MVSFVAKVIPLLKPKRRWLQFSLSTLFIVVTLFSVWLSNRVNPVRLLEQQLKDESEDVRHDATRKLGCLGRIGKGAVPSLVAALNDESTEVRTTAAWAISRVGGDPKQLVPLLSDGDDTVRLAAAEAILWAGGDAAQVAPVLLDLAANRKNADKPTMGGHWNYDAFEIFSALGPEPAAAAIPSLLEAITDDSLKSAAIKALVGLPIPAATVTPRLIKAMSHESPAVRTAAAEQLCRLGSEASEAAGALRASLRDTDRSTALMAAAALGAMTPGDPEALAVFKTALRAEDGFDLQMRAALYLASPDVGPMMAVGAKEELIQILHQEVGNSANPWTLGFASNALQRIGPGTARDVATVLSRSDNPVARLSAISIFRGMEHAADIVVPALITALDDPDEHVRKQAALGLGAFGKDAAAAVPRLCEWLCSDNVRLRSAASSALEDIGILDGAGRAHLIAIMGDTGSKERLEAARTLTFCGEPADTVMPTLIELAPDRDGGFGGLSDLTWMARLGAAAVPKLVESLSHRDPRVRGFTADVLGQIGIAANDAVPALMVLLDDHSLRDGKRAYGKAYGKEVRYGAIEALGRIGPAAAPAIPQLMALLNTFAPNPSDERHPVIVVITALGRIGPAAREAIPTMMVMARNDNRFLMESVCLALGRIEPESPYLVPCLKRYLAAAERNLAQDDFFRPNYSIHHVFGVADVVWELGTKAESLVPDLRRMVFSSPLLNPVSRCHAAYALARFPEDRKDAVSYLTQVSELLPIDRHDRGAATNFLKKIEESLAAESDQNAPSASHRGFTL